MNHSPPAWIVKVVRKDTRRELVLLCSTFFDRGLATNFAERLATSYIAGSPDYVSITQHERGEFEVVKQHALK